MNPPMHTRVRDYFVNAGLTTGFTTQLLMWNDSGNLSDRFMVFRPNGGSSIRNELGAEYYMMVDVIGAKGGNGAADAAVQAIIQRVQSDPLPNNCIGYIENLGGIPAPVLTAEGRLVYRLQFAIKYGE
ncbi:phage tail termination protein [Duffyella gerundensis]|uniref:phage tail termination protein n=1 Tax=Duffyella TaxID=3026546 RepID=UPI003F6E0AE4